MEKLNTPAINSIIETFNNSESFFTFSLHYIDLFIIKLSQSTPSIVGLIAALSAATAAYFTISTNRNNARAKNSIDFETNYKHNTAMTENSEKLRLLLIKLGSKPTSFTMVSEMHELGRKEQTTHYKSKLISKQLNEWERCANGCTKNIYDESFLYGTYGNTVVSIFDGTLAFILSRQNAAENGRNHTLYCKFAWLATKWKVRKALESVTFPSWRLLIAYICLATYHTQIKPPLLGKLINVISVVFNFTVAIPNCFLKMILGKNTKIQVPRMSKRVLIRTAHTQLWRYCFLRVD